MNRFSSPSRLIRVVGKIRGYTEEEYKSLGKKSIPWITVEKNTENPRCTVSFCTGSTRKKDIYELDDCYEQHEELYTIYSREIQNLVLEAFDGINSSVIALGARGSGKTFTIQGSREKPGLAVLAVSEILTKARESGNSVSISLYEVGQHHVYDLLKPDHPHVQVLEDGQGKINLKGLSQVSITDISEFCNIFFSDHRLQNDQSVIVDQSHKHKGLMVCISSENCSVVAKKEGKIHFVDLAGYEDSRKSSRDGITCAESNRNNRSVYALLNVVTAICANANRVPYRESKLTRILQDSLSCTNRILLLTCLNPFFCQASLNSMSLLSRPFQSNSQVLTYSINRSQSSSKLKMISSSKNTKVMSSSTVKKQIGRSAKKQSSILNGRKLFSEEKFVKPKQLLSLSEDISSSESKILPNVALDIVPFSIEENVSLTTMMDHLEGTIPTASLVIEDQMHETASAVDGIEEVECSHYRDDKSSLLSDKIREISDNLKSLCATTQPLLEKTTWGVATCNTLVEPETPRQEHNTKKICSPGSTLSNRTSCMKHSLVREYLNFLNSANKEELKSVKGIGEKRATYILELREEHPEPFKNLDDLQEIGLSAKQIRGMMKHVAGDLFN